MTWLKNLILTGGLAALTALMPASPVLINEVDYDDAGTDDLEFIELINTTGSPVDLATGNYELVLLNGGDTTVPTEYARVDLTGTIPANGFYVIAVNDNGAGSTTVAGADQGGVGKTDGISATAAIQNGAGDGVILVTQVAGTDTLVDGIFYEGPPANPQQTANGLAINTAAAPFTTPLAAADTTDADSASRTIGANTGVNDADFVIQARTPGAANGAVAPTVVDIATFRAAAVGPTFYEITATATTVGNVFTPTQTRLYLQDSSGTDGQSGILAFSTNIIGDAGSVQPGDSVTIRGTRGVFEGEAEMLVSQVIRNGAGTPPAPLAVTPADLSLANTPNIAGELVVVAGVTSPESSLGSLDFATFGDADGQWVSEDARVGVNAFPISLDVSTLTSPLTFPDAPWDLTGIVIVDDGEIVQDGTSLAAGQGLVAPRTLTDIFPLTAVMSYELYR
ncbi:MAG: lamin tail domain-containing protein [Candidatus Sumerlaeia bacterium]|nr:lamin tail domain-containing protein [Candidatus Sumerlaeia bacterium]